MPDEGLTPQPGDREALIRSAIQSWRDGLINLTGANRLLNFKPSRTGSVELIRPPAADVLARLTGHGTFGFRALRPRQTAEEPAAEEPAAEEPAAEEPAAEEPAAEEPAAEEPAAEEPAAEEPAAQDPAAQDPAPPAPDEAGPAETPPLPPPAPDTLDADIDPDDLAAALRSLYRRSSQEYLDRGLSVLYLAFGTLNWTDEDRTRYTSPLLLVPVRLDHKGPRQLPTLEPLEEDRVPQPGPGPQAVPARNRPAPPRGPRRGHPPRHPGRRPCRRRHPGRMAGQRHARPVLLLLRQGGDVPGPARPRGPDRRAPRRGRPRRRSPWQPVPRSRLFRALLRRASRRRRRPACPAGDHPRHPGRRLLAAGQHRRRARGPVVRHGRPARHRQEPDHRQHDRRPPERRENRAVRLGEGRGPGRGAGPARRRRAPRLPARAALPQGHPQAGRGRARGGARHRARRSRPDAGHRRRRGAQAARGAERLRRRHEPRTRSRSATPCTTCSG